MSQARKLRRAAAVQRHRHEDDGTPPMGRVGMVAGISLGLSDDQTTDALNALAGFRPVDATTAMMYARMLELVDVARRHGVADALPSDLDTGAERAKLERSFGVGFATRVASQGQPATSMLGALRALLLLAVLVLWPSSASAAERVSAPALGSHKIQRRNRRRGGRGNLAHANQRAYSNSRGWTRSKEKSAILPRLFTSFRSFGSGCGSGRTSWRNAASRSRSYLFGVSAVSTSAACPTAILTSPSCGRMGRSSVRLTLRGEVRP